MRARAERRRPTSTPPRARSTDVATTLGNAFRSSPVPVLIGDLRRPNHPILAVNAAFEALTGYDGSDVVGRGWGLLHGPGTDRETAARIERALGAGEAIQADLLQYRKDGSAFRSAVAVSPVHGEDGRPVCFFANHLPAAEPEAAQLQATLAERTALLHEVEHRVRNTLQVVSSLVLIKARRMQSEGGRLALQGMAERVNALSCVHRLLYTSGAESRFDLVEFIDDLAGEVRAGLEARPVGLSHAADALSLPASKAAPLALLLHELATNAVRHAFPEGCTGRIAIEARRRDASLVLTVTDDGVGRSAAPPHPESYGLTLAEMLARQMRGRVFWEDAEPGTRATAVIPLDGPAAG